MIGTRGFEELLHKEPLIRLVDTAEEVTALLSEFRRNNFRDGHEELRWKASQRETWENRAATLKRALEDRMAGAPSDLPSGTRGSSSNLNR